MPSNPTAGMTFWVWTGDRQIRRVRTAYFEAVMRQSIGWFDVRETGGLNSRMVEYVIFHSQFESSMIHVITIYILCMYINSKLQYA